jgi:uncharacterized membrane protein
MKNDSNQPPQYPDLEASRIDLPDYEEQALSRQEYVAAMVHFYRGELQRTLEWRKRMDTTTHWALITTVGIVTFSFSNPAYSQETLITGMYANLMFLLHESRRFRFFDMWRSRLRMMEENFYGPILRRDPQSPIIDWGRQVATDLLHPKFKITRLQAMRARLRRNYGYLFVFLLLAWIGRSVVFPQPHGEPSLPGVFSIGTIPWWMPVSLVVALYSFLFGVLTFTPKVQSAEQTYWRDPEHLGDEVPDLDT